jgi:hypothetical protein
VQHILWEAICNTAERSGRLRSAAAGCGVDKMTVCGEFHREAERYNPLLQFVAHCSTNLNTRSSISELRTDDQTSECVRPFVY